MVQSFRDILLWALKFGSPLFLVLVPVFMSYGLLNQHAESMKALSNYENEFILPTGYESHWSGNYESQVRSYLVVMTNPISSITIRLSSDNQGKFEIEQYDGGLLQLIMTYIALAIITWWFWIRKNTHNKCMQSDRPKPASRSSADR